MSGSLLRSGNIKTHYPLGAVGNPIYVSAAQIRAAITRRAGADIADTLAVPQRNETGDTIDWYAPQPGPVVPWSSAGDDEREQAVNRLLQVRQQIEQLAGEMLAADNTERHVFGQMLNHVTRFPSEDHVYLVNGSPVVTFWGFAPDRDHRDFDPLPDLKPADPLPAEPLRSFPRWWLWPLLALLLLTAALLALLLLRGCENPFEPKTPATQDAPGATTSEPQQPTEPLPEPTPENEPPIDVDDRSEPEPLDLSDPDQEHRTVIRDRDVDHSVTRFDDTDAARVSTDAEGVRLDDADGLGVDADDDMASTDVDLQSATDADTESVDDLVTDLEATGEPEAVAAGGPDAATDAATDVDATDADADADAATDTEPETAVDASQDVDQAGPDDTADANAGQDDTDQGQAQDDATEPEGQDDSGKAAEPEQDQTGKAPTDADDTKDAAAEDATAPDGTQRRSTTTTAVRTVSPADIERLLSADWIPATTLQDPKTGKPIKMEYRLKDGEPKVRLRKSDNTTCEQGVVARDRDGKIVLDSDGDIVCKDGTNYGKPSVECTPDTEGRLDCKGRYSDGGTFDVDMKALQKPEPSAGK